MNAQDLRVGNTCIAKNIGEVKITGIMSNGVIECECGNESVLHEIAGIKLNDNKIKTIGFEWDNELIGYFDRNHALYHVESGIYEFHPFCTNDKDCHVKVKYIHDLQNIIYFYEKNKV